MKRYKGKSLVTWKRALLALFLAGVLTFSALLGAVLYGSYDHIQGQPEVMLILGCQVQESGPSVLLRDRLDQGLAYLEEHPDMLVVVSGGQGSNEPSTEARAMADYLLAAGISQERILLEEDSHNTMQNFQYSAQLLEEKGFDLEDTEVLVVSNGFHLTRARMLAQRFGFGAVSTLAAPSSHAPSRLAMYVREPLALVKSFVLDR